MKVQIATLLCLIAGISNCQRPQNSEGDHSELQTILGDDDRKIATDLNESIGIVTSDDKPICTGWFGPNRLVITANHCRGKNLAITTTNGETFRLAGFGKQQIGYEVKEYIVNSKTPYLPWAHFENSASSKAEIYSYDVKSGKLVRATTNAITNEDGVLRYDLDTLPGAWGHPSYRTEKQSACTSDSILAPAKTSGSRFTVQAQNRSQI